MGRRYSFEEIKRTLKEKDAWWTVLVIDPIALPIIWFSANYLPFLSPNFYTIFSGIFSLIAAYSFFKGNFLIGALIYELAFLFDCIDGKLARLTKKHSLLGLWLDKYIDKLRLFANTIALSYRCCPIYGMLFLGFYLWDEILTLGYEVIGYKKGVSKHEEIYGGEYKGFKGFLKKHRLAFLPSQVEMDTVVFFLFPILGKLKLGFIFGIAIAVLRHIAFHVYFKFGKRFEK